MVPFQHSAEADAARDSHRAGAHPVPEVRHRAESQAHRAEAEAVSEVIFNPPPGNS